MAGQQNNSSSDDTIWYAILFIVLFFGLAWVINKYSEYFLLPWKYIRVVELFLSLQIDAALKVFSHDFKTFDKSVEAVNSRVWVVYQFLAIPLIWISWKAMNKSTGEWFIETYLSLVYKRFPALKEIFKINKSAFSMTFKPPFIKLNEVVEYFDRNWPSGEEPMEYLDRNRNEIRAVLKSQLGPQIKWVGRSIEWTDPWAKRVAEQCYRAIPDGTGKTGDPPWKDQSWIKCAGTHRYERTFALGMLGELRRFGVYAPSMFLYIRSAAISDLAINDNRSFIMWRAVTAFGGNTGFPEAMAIFAHYLYERSLTEYLRTHPEDKSLVYQMRADPFVKKVQKSIFELEEIAKTTRKTG